MPYIVYANRNYRSNDRWFIRHTSQSPKEVRSCKSLVATGVHCEISDEEGEEGFGQGVVFHCQAVLENEEETKWGDSARLSFNGWEITLQNGKRVATCNHVSLCSDGTMIASCVSVEP